MYALYMYAQKLTDFKYLLKNLTVKSLSYNKLHLLQSNSAEEPREKRSFRRCSSHGIHL